MSTNLSQATLEKYCDEIARAAGDAQKLDAIYRSELLYLNSGINFDTSKLSTDEVKGELARRGYLV